jgi:hypothetical protein
MKSLALTSLLLLWPASSEAYILDLDYADLKVSKLLCNRDYLVPELDCKDWRGALGLDFGLGTSPLLGTRIFMDNNLHGEGTDAKFKTIGWHYELGLSHTSGVAIGWEHHSRHVFDQHTPHIFSEDWEILMTNKFPVYDAIFIKFKLFGR